jgi:hypothetical protein
VLVLIIGTLLYYRLVFFGIIDPARALPIGIGPLFSAIGLFFTEGGAIHTGGFLTFGFLGTGSLARALAGLTGLPVFGTRLGLTPKFFLLAIPISLKIK